MATGIPGVELVRRIGIGGMAEVFLGRIRTAPRRAVVVKRILPALASEPSVLHSFQRESRIMRWLDHPNIARVIACGGGDEPFLVMEYVRGADLAQVLRRFRQAKRLPDLAFVAQVGADLLAALAHAHAACDERGRPLRLMHRDVSPQNLIVGFDGLTRLVDFGVAKGAFPWEQTRPGLVKGKVAYLAPEQLTGGTVDRRMDLHAAAIVLYELLCGVHPFLRETEAQTIKALLDGAPRRPSLVRRDLPQRVEAVILRALSPQPGDRFPDALEMRAAFTTAVHGLRGTAVVSEPMAQLFPEGPPAEQPGASGEAPVPAVELEPLTLDESEVTLLLEDSADEPIDLARLLRREPEPLVRRRASRADTPRFAVVPRLGIDDGTSPGPTRELEPMLLVRRAAAREPVPLVRRKPQLARR